MGMIKKCADSRILLYLQDTISYSTQFITVSWITAEDMRELNERRRILQLMAKSICRTSSSFTMVPPRFLLIFLVPQRRHIGPAHNELHYRREILSQRDSPHVNGASHLISQTQSLEMSWVELSELCIVGLCSNNMKGCSECVADCLPQETTQELVLCS